MIFGFEPRRIGEVVIDAGLSFKFVEYDFLGALKPDEVDVRLDIECFGKIVFGNVSFWIP